MADKIAPEANAPAGSPTSAINTADYGLPKSGDGNPDDSPTNVNKGSAYVVVDPASETSSPVNNNRITNESNLSSQDGRNTLNVVQTPNNGSAVQTPQKGGDAFERTFDGKAYDGQGNSPVRGIAEKYGESPRLSFYQRGLQKIRNVISFNGPSKDEVEATGGIQLPASGGG
jgi:hypothetical protein